MSTRYTYTGEAPITYAEWEDGYQIKICRIENGNRESMPNIYPGEKLCLIYKRDFIGVTLYASRLKISISMNNAAFKAKFKPIVINYNDYWAKLNEVESVGN